ncbi:MAG: hypothetical protein DRJ60_00185 [Thermoprotei archaeon]|nr:MAG: hypothetical protein DRJ60_00185 [Thermoprotei archaeon]
MKRCLVVTVLAVLIVAVMLATPVVAAGPVVTITVVGPDGEAVSGAKVTLYDADGDKYENTTDINGVTEITVPANGTYLIVVKSEYYILDTVDVAGDTSYTVNATALHHANVTSTPLSVDVKILLLAFDDVELTLTTNETVYAPSDVNVTYPSEITRFPYKYTFDKIKYDGVETNETTVTVDMARDYAITGYYTKTFYMALEHWMVILLVIVIIVALAIAWSAGAKTAKAMVEEWRRSNKKYVRKKEE